MTNDRLRTPGLALAFAVLTLSAAGCSARDAGSPGQAQASTPAAARSLAGSSIPSAAPGSVAPSPSGAAGCPVEAATLERAFKANTALADAIVMGSSLREVACYQDFATALTTPDQVDTATVLFSFNPATATWSALTGGTDVNCADKVPAAIIPHLPRCHGQ
jgi:hypothetical protein